MIGSMCNFIKGVALLDFAYLALNVYHTPGDEKYLGIRPRVTYSIHDLMINMEKYDGWFQLDFSELKILHEHGFHAELYAKVYNGKIQHLMTAFRGTVTASDMTEDAATWWSTVLPGSSHYSQAIPHYFDYALAFIMSCNNVIRDLDDENLLAPYCGQHVTGHSLGGALANLVAARSVICRPPHTQSVLPVMPEVISFNAPGIAGMPIVQSGFLEGMVISMRAHYDMVSALDKPYGFVINNDVPEGYQQAHLAFALENMMENANSLQQILCDGLEICPTLERAAQIGQAKAIYKQHLMGNFMNLILKQPNAIGLSFTQLRQWAQQHGGYNHNFNGPCMYSESEAVMAA
jgi:hypothetical protein